MPEQVLSDLLWAAGGINRHETDGRTAPNAPNAMNAQEVLLHVAMPQGLFLHEPKTPGFEHLLAARGVFAHTLEIPDLRAEGTLGNNHIRGHGLRGQRVFDSGREPAKRGWGSG